MTDDKLSTTVAGIITLGISAHVMNTVLSEVGENTSGETEFTGPTATMGPFLDSFAEASHLIADAFVALLKVAGLLAGATIALALVPILAGVVTGIVKHRKRWDKSTFGRRYDHREKDPLPFSDDDARCVNCHAEVDDGVRNVATENTVLFGFDVIEHGRIETLECEACHEADWFDYAMRAGEHEEELFALELDEDDGDDDTSDPVDCPECGQECKNDHGLRVHIGRQHPELMEELKA